MFRLKYIVEVHELTATEEEEKCHVCSQCNIFQQEHDKKIEECDKSRIEVCQNAIYNIIPNNIMFKFLVYTY